ncbi:MAG: type II toxin-antitoxin system VapC family toxin [bacterium]
MNRLIFDSSAIIAFVNNEKGWENVFNIISGAYINAINLAEVIEKLKELELGVSEILEIFDQLDIKIVKFDRELAVKTANLKIISKKYGLSLADRACIATGIYMNMGIVTADRIWAKLELPVKITLIR